MNRRPDNRIKCLVIPRRYSGIPSSFLRIVDDNDDLAAYHVAEDTTSKSNSSRIIRTRQHAMPGTNFRYIADLQSIITAVQPDVIFLEEELFNTAAMQIVQVRRRLGCRFRIVLLVGQTPERSYFSEKMHLAFGINQKLLDSIDGIVAFDWQSVHRYHSSGYSGNILHLQSSLLNVKQYPSHETLIYHAARHDVFSLGIVTRSADQLDFARTIAAGLGFSTNTALFGPMEVIGGSPPEFAKHPVSEKDARVLNNLDILVLFEHLNAEARELAVRAMTCGAPIAAPASALPEDFIGPCGISYTDGNAADLHKSISEVHRRNSLETALRVRQWANKNFDERRAGNRLAAFVAELCVERTYGFAALLPRLD